VVRAVVCPDKLRGTLTAVDAAAAIDGGLRAAGVADVVTCPLADGGEGTLDTIVAAVSGSLRRAHVTGPLGGKVEASYGVLPGGVALVEMAQASGLALVAGGNDPLRASTRGTGELVRAAVARGARRLIVGVGGSATTDGGLAAVDALGWSLHGVDVTVACDVDTRFLDAAAVYGPQKGATRAQVALLTRRLEQIAQQYEQRLGVDVRDIPGSGAAGGLAGGLAALGARLERGFDVVADAVELDDLLDGAELVVTGEGRVDETSLAGKVVGGVLDLAEACGVPHRAVIAGQVTTAAREQLEARGALVLALVDRAFQESEAFTRAAVLAGEAAQEVARRTVRR
jgi:glycerate kinase